jgi:hypothetical protein
MPAMHVRMLLGVRMLMVAMRMVVVAVAVLVVMLVVVVLGMFSRLCLFREYAVLQNVHLGRTNSTAIHRVDLQLRPNPQRRRRFLQKLRRHASVDQRTQQHVSGNSREALNLADFHIVICREPAFS